MWRASAGRLARVLMLAALALTGCAKGAQAPEQRPADGETAAVSEPGRPAEHPSAQAPPTEAADPSTAAGRAEHRFEISGGPDYLAATASAVWVKKDSGTVDRIDPESNAVVASVEVSDSLCQGLGASRRTVWTCSGTDVVRIDPVTNEIAARVPAGKSTFQGQIGVAFGHAWVLDSEGTTLLGISEATSKIAVRVPLGTPCVDVAVSADRVWATCGIADQVLGIDPALGRVVTRARRLEEVRAIAALQDAVWVGYAGGVARIAADTGEVTRRAVVDVSVDTRLTASADGLWLRNPQPFLLRLNPTTLDVVEELTAPDVASSGSVLVAFGSVWASGFDDAVVYRLRPRP